MPATLLASQPALAAVSLPATPPLCAQPTLQAKEEQAAEREQRLAEREQRLAEAGRRMESMEQEHKEAALKVGLGVLGLLGSAGGSLACACFSQW